MVGPKPLRRMGAALLVFALLVAACAEKRSGRRGHDDDRCAGQIEEQDAHNSKLARQLAEQKTKVKDLEEKLDAAKDAQKKAELQLKLCEMTDDDDGPPLKPFPRPPSTSPCHCKPTDPLCDCL